MNPNGAINRSFLGLLGLLGISGWMIGAPDLERGIQPEFKASVRLAPQHQTDRSWRPWNWRKTSSIGAAQGLGEPIYVQLGPGDSVIVLDPQNYAIRRISSSGRITESIRITPAVWQESSGSYTGLASQEDGMIWVCNPNQRAIGFLSDGTVLRRLPREERAMRLGVVKDRMIATLVNSDQLFAVYTTGGQLVRKFGEFLVQQYRTPVLVDGWLAVDAVQQSFFYAPRYGGFLASYNSDGTQRFVVQTVDAPPLPKLQVKTDGTVLYPSLSKKISSLSAHDGKLYVLVNQAGGLEENKQPSVLDVYASNDGSYLFSSALPGRYTEIAVGNNLIYTGGKSGIDVWKRLPPTNAATRPLSKTGTR